jgi:hypothetical protein
LVIERVEFFCATDMLSMSKRADRISGQLFLMPPVADVLAQGLYGNAPFASLI